jgi:hypothetical protein
MTIRFCAMAVSFSLLGACAATAPPASTPAPLTMAAVGAPANGVSEAQQQQFIKMAAHLGYRVEMVNSERHYCKTQDVTESHLAKKECLNENQMAAKIKNGGDSVPGSLLAPNNSGVITRQMMNQR